MATLPNPNPIPNSGLINYNYQVDPSLPLTTGANNTNIVTTQVNTSDIVMTKLNNKSFANVGDTITYTIALKNSGNVTANSLVFTDTIPTDTTFVASSVFVNGVQQSGANPAPPTGVTIASIPPNTTTTVVFQVQVATIPNPNPITNNSTSSYNYVVDPVNNPAGVTGGRNSNAVPTQVNNANIQETKLVNKTFANVGDVLTYTLLLSNIGNVAANNVKVIDTIPNNTAFVTNSVTVNGTTQTGASPAPPSGFTISTIAPNTTSTVTFQVTILTIPNPNPIPNTATTSYNYTVVPTIPNGGSGGANTNTTSTLVSNANLTTTKVTNKSFAKVGDIITYTISLTNNGSTTANNAVFIDTIPTGTTFVTNSLTLDTVQQTGANPAPPSGFTVGTINPSATRVITFQVVVNTIPTPNPIPNTATTGFNYTIDPANPNGASGSAATNTVTTQVSQATIDNSNGGGLVKSVDKAFAKVGDVVTYTIVLKNTGNVAATSVVFTDTIPTDTTFVANSVTLNGATQTGANPAPPTGVSVGTINALSTSTIVFKVTVNTVPNPNPIPNNGTVTYNFTVIPTVPNGESGSGNTNTVNTQVNQATIDNTNGGGLVKAVDKAFAKVGDVLNYTITLKNTGNVTATSVVFTDTIPSGTTFVTNSVFLNLVNQPGFNPAPPSGFNAGNIAPGATTTIAFQVVVNTIPNPNPIPNNSTVKFNYTLDPAVPNGASSSGNSNTVTTKVNQATIDNTNGGGLVKAVNKAFADVNDVLTYTIVLKNTGNVTADNVVFTDTTPNGTTFNANSVTVNGATVTGGDPNPPSGVNVGNIAPGSATTITFTVTVFTIPNPNPIPNNGTVNYVYTVDPALPDSQSGSGNTNTVNTQVNNASFNNGAGGITKFVDKTTAKVGDVLNYTIVLANKGNVTANNVVFTDTIPNSTSFVTNSFKLNGATQTGANPAPPSGFGLSPIGPNVVNTITFQVTITTIPTINPIPNSGKIAYNYTTDPAVPNGKSGQDLSNTVNTSTAQATIDNSNGGGMVKFVDKANAKVGDVLTYTIALKNTGNVTADNVVFIDTIPNNTVFVANSVVVNGTTQTGATPAPPSGVSVGNIGPSVTTTVVFQVTVATIPSPNPIPNQGSVGYQYTVDPAFPDGATGTGASNIVNTQVSQATIDNSNGGGLVKSVDKAFAKVGDVITYTIVLKNTGNVAATSVVFTDTIPTDTTFVANSVTLNGATQTGANPAPPTGVSVGTINALSTSTIVFKVTVNTVPNPNPIPNNGTVTYNFTVIPTVPNGESGSGNTNTVNTQVNQATIDNTNGGGLVKAVDKAFAKVGDVLNYTITLKNTGNVTATSVVFSDTIPNGTTFVTNSVFLNLVNQPGFNPAPPSGFNAGNIAPGATTTIAFQVVVNTIPNPNPIPNNASVKFNYTLDPAVPNGASSSGNSNTVTTKVNQATIDNTNGSGLVKAVNKAFADVNDVLTYTIVLKNTGNVTADNVVFTDTTPNGTTFNANSVTVNGATVTGGDPNPPSGVNVGNIAPGSATTITFTVTVFTIPNPNPIPNNGTVNYVYTVDPALPDGQSGSGNTNTVNTQVNNASFNNGANGIVKFVDKTNAKVGDVLNYTIVLANKGNVTANNVVFTDTIPNSTTFVTNSFKLNGTTQSGVNPAPPSGVSLSPIGPNVVNTITFQVTITTIPTINPIPNSGKIAYNYTTDPAVPNGKSGQDLSNTVNTTTNQATIDNTNGGGMVKFVDKANAQVGEVLTYTIALKNTGNVTADNVVFIDTIPNNTAFVANSVVVNGTTQTGATPAPPTGVSVGNIGPSLTTTVVFQVTVLTIPTPNPIPNQGSVGYQYTIDPAFPDGATGTGASNTVKTQVSQATIDNTNGAGLVKFVDKAFAKVGDVITYTIVLKNTGNVAATSVVFTDTIPTDTTFVTNSVTLNGATQTGANPAPPTGISVGTINALASSTIVFKVTVNTVPNPNPILNNGTVNYNFTIIPTIPNGGSGSGNTNTVNTQVNQATIDNNNGGGLVKSVDKAFGQVGDILNYTIALKNTGNVTASNVILTDTIPNGTTFVTNSVFINGVQQSGQNPAPPIGLNAGNIGPGLTTTVVFQVLVNTIPSPNPIPNNATVNYRYTIDPAAPNAGSGSGNSNKVNTQINQGTIDFNNGGGLVKSVDLAFADVNDTLTYTIRLKNTGNVTTTNTVFTDTIPNGTSFISNSVFVNGTNQSGANPAPPTGVNVGSIAPNAVSTIVFKVTVTTIPNPNPIPNNGTVNYNFTIDPSKPDGGSGSGNSNTVNTQVNSANFSNNSGGLTKIVNKAFAKVNDVLTYTLIVKNTGNATANNVIFTDTIPSGTTFVNNSFTINNVTQSGANPTPPTGVNIGTIAPLNVVTLTFKVTVNTIPTPNPIPNSGKVDYNYTVNPSFPNGKSGANLSNTVNTQINQGGLNNNDGSVVKFVNTTSAKVNDVLTYTIVLTNKGNVTVNNIVFTDTIPNGTTFVSNSLFFNNVNQPGLNPIPPTGFNAGSIAPLQASTITFQVTVITIPTPNPIPNSGTVTDTFTVDPAFPDGQVSGANTNIVKTQVSQGAIDYSSGGFTKYVDKAFAKVNDVLTYTIVLKNTGNVAVNNLVFTDTTPNDTTFVNNSVVVNNIPQSGANPNPPNGINVGTLNPLAVSTIVFKVTVNTIPSPNPVPNAGTVNYTYTVDPNNPNGATGAGNSNIVTTQVNQGAIDNGSGGLTKFVSKAFAKVNDVLTYTIVLTNTGNVPVNNVVFTDTTPNNTSYITNSLTLNGVVQSGANPNPPNGFNVGTINSLQSATITFNVSILTIPSPNPIPNNGTVKFVYTVDPSVPNGASSSGNTNTVKTQVNQGSINVNDGGLIKYVSKSYAQIGDTLIYTLVLKNTGNVPADNVVLTDTIPNDTTFVANSVVVNGTNRPGENPAPPSGINVGQIQPSSVVTLNFNVTINTIPNPNPIPNSGTVNYNYTVDPAIPDGQPGTGNSNIVNTKVNQAIIDFGRGFVKAVNKSFAKVNDVLIYTLALTNTGDVTATNVVFTDTTPSGTTFINNSFTLNGLTQSGANPNPPNGVNLGFIAPGRTTTITFNVTVNTIPNPNPIPNAGNVKFNYTVDPSLPNGGSGTGNSNIVNTQINQVNIDNGKGLTKYVSKAYASINDVLTYTIVVNNTGNVNATNVVLTDTIPNGTSFVSNSVTLNGSNISGANPGSGITIGTVQPNVPQTVTFNVTITTVPTPNPIPNAGTVAYNYTLDPALPNGASGTGNTNIVTTQVNSANINSNGGITKYVNTAFAKVNDILTYTVVLKNSGTVAANNVIFTDTTPSGTTFNPGSLTQNNISIAGNPNPPSGVNLGSIAANVTQTLSFKVTVNTIPSPNPIPNSASVNYVYTEDPAIPNGKANGGSSNIVTTKVNQATIDNSNGNGLVKAVDKAFAKVNDVLTYTITIKNTGNADATNVVFSDTIPSGTTLVPNSVTIDGTPQGSANPQSGVTVGTVTAGNSRVLTFQVTVITIPNPNPIPNNGTVLYNFTINPANPNGGSGSGNTNTVTTKVNQATIDNNNGNGLKKSVNKAFATIGDILTYTISLKNTGNIDATNVILTDTIPNGTTFVNGSVTLNGVSQGGQSPVPGSGVSVGTLAPNQTSTVTFNVLVITVPNPNPIPNNSTVNYNYTVDPANPGSENGSGNSNTPTTKVNTALLNSSKIVNKSFAAVGEPITYTIVTSNYGNVTANSVVIFDTLPSGTALVANSVKLNGNTLGGANPQNGVNIGNISVNGTSTLTFNVIATTIPNPNPITNSADAAFNYVVNPQTGASSSGRTTTNSVNTTINQATLQSSKATDKTFANIGDTITYSVTLNNLGNVAANNVIFSDTIPNGTTFVANSITVNGTPVVGTVAPPGGVNIGSLNAGSSTVVAFQVLVSTIPTINPIVNTATTSYNFTVDPSNPNSNSGATNTNSVRTTINNADFAIVKSVNSAFAKVSDTLTYTITLNNTGNVAATNVTLTDQVPNGTTYVANSLTVGGVNAGASSIASGINVGTVNGKAQTIVTFQVVINTIPNPDPIPNNATVNFNYTVDPSSPNGGSGLRTSNTVTTKVNQGYLNLAKAVNADTAIFGDVLTYTLTLSNPGNVAINNVLLTDAIPSGTTLVPNSVTINGTTQAGANIGSGLQIGSISAGGSTIVTFNVLVGNALPVPNPIPNFAKATFNYTVNPASPNGQNGSSTSNTVNTQINNGGFNPSLGGISKTVDKLYSTVGETLTYTVNLKNTGNVAVNNLILTDTIPNGTSFVENSVTLNGSPLTGTNPSPGIGIPLGSLNPAASDVITFKVIVNTIPNPNPIVNKAIINFSYNANPNRVINDATESNGANTTINSANLQGFSKSVDKAFANINEVLTYTINITNTGNVVANNVIVKDVIPGGTTLVANSVTIDGTTQNGLNPQNGVSLGNVLPGATRAITFKVLVVSIPSVNPIPNAATVSFTFVQDPTKPPVAVTGSTNTVTTQINNGNISGKGFTKSVDKAFAQVGETVTYTITASNSGNVPVLNVIVTDTIPNGSVFVPGSVTVNGLPTGANVATGVPLGTINPGASNTIVFKVTINQLPNPNPMLNAAIANYDYSVNPNSPLVSAISQTNTVKTQVNNPDFSGNNFVKTVNKAYAGVGDTVTYTITLNNKGNIAANNIKVTDLIPNGTSLVANSVTVNGTTQTGANPQNGVNVGTVNANGTAVVTFKVVINTIPNPNPIPNSASLNYTYTVDPSSPNGASGNGTTNTVTTQVNNSDVAIVKAVDKSVASVGDELEYSFTLTNTGNVNANNVILTDAIPVNSSFIAGSVTLNGSALAGVNPQGGVNIGTLAPGATAVVRFKVSIDLLPSPNPMQNKGTVSFNFGIDPSSPNSQTVTRTSNTVSTVVNTAAIDGNNFTKSVDKTSAKVGDLLLYTINLTNSGNIDANNLVLTDPAPQGTTFVPGSVTINGVPQSSANITSGVNLGSLASKASSVVSFTVKVVSIPLTNPIVNAASLNYSYTPDPSLPAINKTSTTNKVNTNILYANVTDNLVKSVDKAIGKIGEIVTYTSTLKNTGNTAATNVIFTDPIPVGTTLIANSVTVNGTAVNQNPATGVSIGTLNPGDQKVVVFQVTVNQIPVINPIPNTTQVDYLFAVDPVKPPAAATGFSNTVNTLVSDGGLNEFRKAVDKTTANIGEILTYTVTAKNNGNIPTNNILVTDAIPNGTTFVTGSVTINGVSDSTQNPANGISTPDLLPGQTVAVTFQVKVNSVPTVNPMPNFAAITFTYRPDPNGAIVNGAGQTNTVLTQVNTADISGNNLVKSVDKQFADIGDIVTYTTTLKNTGNIAATNVLFTDPIPTGTTFVTGSVTVNGAAQGNANPGSGIVIGTVNANSTTTVVFQVKVNSIPAVNPIPNKATVNYNYTVTPGSAPLSASGSTNTVFTTVNNANISGSGLSKMVDLTQANTNSVLGYTITLKNSGNVTANNVILTDPIPNGTTFVPNSVSVNGVNVPGTNPANGVPVGSIAPGGIVTLFFQVKVIALPSPNPIPNKATVAYNYLVDPQGASKNATNVSNTVFTTVTTATLSNFVKNVDKTNANLQDILTYSLSFTNTGNITATNVTLVDPLPNGTTFIANSVLVNGILQNGAVPASGIAIPDVAPGGSVSVSYKVTVTSNPTPNPIPNTANANYTFIVNGAPVTSTATSNTVFTLINFADITGSIVKSVSKNYADFGDVLTYTISVRNTGTVTASNVTITDPVPSGTTFVPGSVTINGVASASSNPGAGVLIPAIPAGGIGSIQFNVTVNNGAPQVNPIPDTAKVDYTFIVDANNPPVSGNANSNTVFTQVNSGALVFNKSVDRNIADLGYELVYTITATNVGTVNSQNVVIIDTIPNGTVFEDGTVSINGVPNLNANPAVGINLGVVPVGSTSVITYRVLITTLPIPNPIPNKANGSYNYSVDPNAPNKNASGITNTVLTTVRNGNISPNDGGFVKSVDKAFAKVSDTVTYTVVIKNTGNVPVNNVFFSDTLPTGTTFVANSLTLNGATQTGGNPQGGLSLGTLAPNVVNTITFKVVVNVIPAVNPIPNTGAITYNYVVNPADSPTNKSSLTNTVKTQINNPNIDPNNGGIVKFVDKVFADVGDTLNYSIVITNSGNVAAQNVVFKDTIPNGTTLVPGSVTVGGVTNAGDLNSGILIPSIPAGGSTTVIFSAVVATIPVVNPIPNSGNLAYSFIYDPNAAASNATTNTNIVTTQINSANFNNNSGGFVKIVDKTATNVNGVITYSLTVKNTGNVSATSVIVTDPIPNSTVYVANSLTVDGSLNSSNPATGINLGSIAPGVSRTIVFKVKVTQIPDGDVVLNTASIRYSYLVNPALPPKIVVNPSNTVTTNIFYGNLDLSKDVDKSYAEKGDLLTYTVAFSNKGNTTINNVVLLDTIPTGSTFVANSVSVNGSVRTGVNPQSGLQLGSIGPNNTTVVTFQVTVNNMVAPNITNPIINNATSSYNYNVAGASVSDSRVSNPAITNISFANFNGADGSILKTVDKLIATLGDVLTYTITLKNTGNATASNSFFTDPIPLGTKLVESSVTVNGNSQNINPAVGIPLGNIAPLSTVVISFKVTVVTLPSVNPIPNTGSITYSYIVNPNFAAVNALGISNTVFSQINYGDLSGNNITKSVTPTLAAAGDVLVYTVVLNNGGNVTVNNITLTDTIPSGTVLVPGSVSVNGLIIAGANPSAGISIGSIAGKGSIAVVFKVTVISIPNPNPIPNSANVVYNFNVDANRTINGSGNSNIVFTQINSPYIDPNNGDFVKSADKQTAQVGDVVTYSIFVRNSGNLAANNLVVSDSIPNNTTFVNNSVTVGGLDAPNVNIANGVTIPNLDPQSAITVTFKATVASIPANNIVENFANLVYNFTLKPGAVPRVNTVKSNVVDVIINSADFSGDGFVKSEDKTYAAIGDTVTYSFKLKNKGNIPANNVVFVDTDPRGSSFVPGSLIVNGAPITNNNPNSGIFLGTIAQGASETLSYSVIITTIPSPNPMPNTATLNFQTNTGGSVPTNNSATSNTVFVTVTSPNIIITKSVNPDTVKLNDVATYTVNIINIGNTAANNLLIRDVLPAELEFINNSLTINGVASSESIINGINLGTLAINGNVTLTFDAKAIAIPPSSIIENKVTGTFEFILIPGEPPVSKTVFSNIARLKVVDLNVVLTKTSNKKKVNLGETVDFTATITNTGNVTVTNFIFKDELPDDLQFVPGTFNVNGNTINVISLIRGVNIGTIKPGQTITVTYEVKVISSNCNCGIENKAFGSYNYKLSATTPIQVGLTDVSTVKVDVTCPNFKQLNDDGFITIPCDKPPIEDINDVSVSVNITSAHIVKTIAGTSDANQTLTGYKAIVSGEILGSVEYTALVANQSVHSFNFRKSFSTFIVLPANYEIGRTVDITADVEGIDYELLSPTKLYTNTTFMINAQIS